MASLYQLTAELQRAHEAMEEAEEQDNPLAAQELISQWLEDKERDIAVKIDGMCRWLGNAEAAEAALDEEIKKLQAKKKVHQNLQKNLRNYMKEFLIAAGLKKFDAVIRKISIIAGKASMAVDPSKILDWDGDVFDAAVKIGAVAYEPILKNKNLLKSIPGWEKLPGVSEVIGEDSIRIA